MTQGLYRAQLPSVLSADAAFVNFVRIFEDVGTPLYEAPDAFPALFDPKTASPEVARYLASWLSVAVDESLPTERQRKVTSAVATHFGTRGTRLALETFLAAVTGGDVSVTDPGRVQRFETADDEAPLPVVDIHISDLGGVPIERIDGLVRGELPAWIPFRIIVDGDPSEERPT